MNHNLLVGQSGGPTAVINGSLYGVVSEGLANPEIDNVIGMINGIEGFLANHTMDMAPLKENGELERIRTTPGSYLGSCRYKLPEDLSDPVYPELFQKFTEKEISYFFYIGGNDSMDTVSKLSRYAATVGSDIRIIGVPKTIDNDLVLTDHTPGYGSAAKYVASTVREIAIDASVYDNKPSVTIVEIMGRHAGWLTAASALARKEAGDNPLLIYLPEAPFELAQFNDDLKKAFEKTANVIVCVSEGIRDHGGRFICEYSTEAQVDTFGHKMLAGCGKILENYIRNQFGVKVRSVELNVNQRCSGLTVSGTDLNEAEMAGRFGVQAALDGHTGQMVAFERETDTAASEPVHAATAVSNAADLDSASASCVKHSNTVYKIHPVLKDVNLICNQEKKVPAEWITKNGTDVSDDFLAYSQPLIQGDVSHIMENGLPKYLYRK